MGRLALQQVEDFLRAQLRDQNLRFENPKAPAAFRAARLIVSVGLVRFGRSGLKIPVQNFVENAIVNNLGIRPRSAAETDQTYPGQ